MMRDVPLALLFLLLAWLAARRPWHGLLGLVFVAVLHPQGYAVGWLRDVPVYTVLGVIVAVSTAVHMLRERRLPQLFWDWRFAIAALFAIQMVLTTWLAINPTVGWSKLASVVKMVPLLALILILIDSREKLFLLSVTIAASIAAVVLKGGYWALLTGFRDRVYGPPTSEFADNNEFAVTIAMTIPLLVLWARHVEEHVLRWFLHAVVVLAFIAALSSWSRGGLLTLGVVAAVLVWHSRKRWLAVPLLLAGAGLMIIGLPDAWFVRMQTLGAPATEASAATRLQVWQLGMTYALQNPWTGGGFGSHINLSHLQGGATAWHSAYVTVAAEHGLVGLALWCALLFGTMISLTKLSWNVSKNLASDFWVDQAIMLRASLAAYAVGSVFLSIAYWEFLGLMLVQGILTSRLVRKDGTGVQNE